MSVNEKIISVLKENGIYSFGFVPFSDCSPVNKRLYDECAERGMKSVIIFAIPYKTAQKPKDSYKMSAYARVYDYHKKFSLIFDSLLCELKSTFPEYGFLSYADNSPVNEKTAAALSGIGVIGRNTLLITEKYGSYVFLGSVITDMETESTRTALSVCIGCGRCAAACPNNAIGEKSFDFEKCLSYISQKNVKTDEEAELLKKHGTVWGCDICQQVCPMNEDVSLTDDGYFTDSFIYELSYAFIEAMNDADFHKYPFSWRKKQTILYNISLINSYNDNKKDDS
ncbi:MAG: DUF1730 domain-containing protein [Eubacteriales bacterium]|nr:DUF1730 domain-containing protein [Eubacteriales bacterium]